LIQIVLQEKKVFRFICALKQVTVRWVVFCIKACERPEHFFVYVSAPFEISTYHTNDIRVQGLYHNDYTTTQKRYKK